MSVMMLKTEVAVSLRSAALLSWDDSGGRGVRTVEEGRGIDAASGLGLGEVPHLVKRPALADGDYEADEEEDGVQDNGGITEDPESSCQC